MLQTSIPAKKGRQSPICNSSNVPLQSPASAALDLTKGIVSVVTGPAIFKDKVLLGGIASSHFALFLLV